MNNQLTVFSPQKVMGTSNLVPDIFQTQPTLKTYLVLFSGGRGTTRVTAERAAYQYETYGTLRFWVGNECVAHFDGYIVNGYQVIG